MLAPQEDPEKIAQVLRNHPDCAPVRFIKDAKSTLLKA